MPVVGISHPSCCLLQEELPPCYAKMSGATVISGEVYYLCAYMHWQYQKCIHDNAQVRIHLERILGKTEVTCMDSA